MRPLYSVAVFLLVYTGANGLAADEPVRSRRPVAICVSSDGQWLYVANRNSGTISVIESGRQSVSHEIDVGGQLSDLCTAGEHLLALDERNHQLVLLSPHATQSKIVGRLKLARFPVRMQLSRDGKRCLISSLWSRTITSVDLTNIGTRTGRPLRVARQQRLAFEPRELCLDPSGKILFVAGSFGGQLAALTANELKLVASRVLPAHNIRGLAISHDNQQLLVSHQQLNPLAHSTRDDVHWGNMISNVLTSYSVAAMATKDRLEAYPTKDRLEAYPTKDRLEAYPTKDRLEAYPTRLKSVVKQLGEPGRAAGDPGPVAIAADGRVVIALSGVNEIAIGGGKRRGFQRLAVGRRPTAMVTTNGRLFVANTFSDSLSIVDLADARVVGQVKLGPPPTLSLAERGEMLFFDSRLSHDGWMSCNSCHTDGHTNGQLNDNISDGSLETPKRVLSLLGAATTGPWAWNGGVQRLETQVSNSIEKTMQGETPSQTDVSAIVAYLRTLSPPPAAETRGNNRSLEQRGARLFRALDCQRCHTPPTYTSAGSYDVGLRDAAGTARFNPPSLRGLAVRQAFFHDSRVSSLKDVLVKHKHQLKRDLSEAELQALVHFLRTL